MSISISNTINSIQGYWNALIRLNLLAERETQELAFPPESNTEN